MTVRMRRRGFTLVELLVVISIIGMLAALLLPAVQGAREAGRKTQCINNQRQLGLAVVQFEQRHNRYPGFQTIQVDGTNLAGNVQGQITVTGWVFPLLPFLERNDLVDTYGELGGNLTGGMRPTSLLKLVLCPSDVQAESNTEPNANDACSYVVNCGMRDTETMSGGSVNNGTPRDYLGNGVFHSAVPFRVLPGIRTENDLNSDGYKELYVAKADVSSGNVPEGPVVNMSSSFITRGDGTATTLMLSENPDSGNWTDVDEEKVGFVWVPGIDVNNSSAPGPVPPGSSTPALFRINENVGVITGTPPHYLNARPASYHPGGVVVTFCDSHTSFINDTIDYLVYCLLMTPRGKIATDTGVAGGGGLLLTDPSHPNTSTILQAYAITPLDEGSF